MPMYVHVCEGVVYECVGVGGARAHVCVSQKSTSEHSLGTTHTL